MKEETYLGDGLYASFDGMMIRVWTDRGLSLGIHELFFEPAQYQAFRAFGAKVWELLP